MSITESLKYTLSKYVDFSGRASRREWVTWWLSCFVIDLVLGALTNMTANANGNSPLSIVTGLFSLAILLPSIAVMARRLHDTGRSGWLILLNFIPVVGWIIVIVLCLGAGQPVGNQYGPPTLE
ncbi:DUF805 domain-containing protein [Brooklawnia sp.]|uniref:DUF805 domain-containing protein n=1 Tax=Brooklawnia sp. TaxID=2699740 RepID=UPI00311F9FC6